MKKINFCLILLVVFFSFNYAVKAEVGYDLKAESLTMTSAKCEVNQTCAFTARVKNLGGNFTMDFPLNPSVTAANSTDSQISVSPAQGTGIQTNNYITFTVYRTFTKIGQVDMTFKIDPAGYLTESNTNNNSISLKVNVVGYDLAIESLTITPAKPTSKQNSYLRIKVKNNSSYNLYTSAGLDFIKSFPDFTITKASSTIPSIDQLVNGGSYLYYEYEGNFSGAGDKKFSFTIDPKDDLKEADSANNTVNATISVLNAAETDLAVNALSFSPAKPLVGQPVDITIGVKNMGKTSLTDGRGLTESEVSRNFTNFSFSAADDLTIDADPTLGAPLKPNDVFHYVYHGAFTKAGQAVINFTINKDNHLVELNEANSSTSTAVMVYNNLNEANDFSFTSQKLVFASSTTTIVSWSTSLATTGKVYYGLKNGSVSANQVEAAASGLNFSATINGLTPGTDYIYQIAAKNGTLEKQDAISSFSTPLNNVLAFTSGPSLANFNKTATTTWATNLTSSGYVYYRKPGQSGFASAGSDTAATDHSVILNNLEDVIYEYYIVSTSTARTFVKTALANFDNTKPVAQATTTSQDSQAQSQAGKELTGRLLGKIILKPGSQTELYYFDPKSKTAYYLTAQNAFAKIKKTASGVSNQDLAKLAVSLTNLSGADADKDGLPDDFELALGTNKNKKDTDGDKFSDKDELIKDFLPTLKGKKLAIDRKLADKLKGKFLLQTQSKGQLWYLNPADGRKYFITAKNAFTALKGLAVKISESDFASLSK